MPEQVRRVDWNRAEARSRATEACKGVVEIEGDGRRLRPQSPSPVFILEVRDYAVAGQWQMGHTKGYRGYAQHDVIGRVTNLLVRSVDVTLNHAHEVLTLQRRQAPIVAKVCCINDDTRRNLSIRVQVSEMLLRNPAWPELGLPALHEGVARDVTPLTVDCNLFSEQRASDLYRSYGV